jgi:hypothetical protein
MTERDQQRVAEWIGDAFAILYVRVGGLSVAERNLRLSFEAILRHLGSSPLREVSRTPPPAYGQVAASSGDLRNIIRALDSCLAVLQRYDAVLNTAQRRIQILVRASRRYAEEELEGRQSTSLASSEVERLAVPAEALREGWVPSR